MVADVFEKCYKGPAARAMQAKKEGWYPYFKAIQSGADTKVIINDQEMIMIGSNNYLGLTQDPRVKEAAKAAIDRFGSGCTGSRFLNGTLSIHEELEEKLADFMGMEATLLFSTGFQVNQGVISTIVGRKDFVVGDNENHASIVDGERLAWGKSYKYRHNDMADLQKVLKRVREQINGGGILVVTDGVFSMGGDIVNLPEMIKIAKENNARVMVDDAHSIGVLGKNGSGTAEHFGLEKDVDLVMGTFSKSFASIGGYIAGSADVINHIKHTARALIFSASPPPAAVATVLECLDIIQKEPERREKLWHNYEKMKTGFSELGFNTGASATPIIPLIIGDDEKTFSFWKILTDNGIFSNPVVSPAVPPGMSLIRTSYMATHSDEELNIVLDVCEKAGKAVGII